LTLLTFPMAVPVVTEREGRREYAERAAFAIQAAVADFFIVIQRIDSVAEATEVRRLLESLSLHVGAAESAALAKLDAL
jgi:hypothetical protein